MEKRLDLSMILILLGFLFSVRLQLLINDEVFFSGDAGLKALLVKQISGGNFKFNLDLQSDPWVEELWKKGFYPFRPPFVYKQANRYFMIYPFFFPLISAPFYACLGWRGLYVLPLLSLWLLWLLFHQCCKNLSWGREQRMLLLCSLIFSSPLTINSGMFWEHLIASCLCFAAVSFLITSEFRPTPTHGQAFLNGSFLGIAVWIRPESAVLAIALFISMWLLDFPTKARRWAGFFFLAVLCWILLFMWANWLIYRTILGIHSMPVLDHFTLYQRSVDYFLKAKSIGRLFIRFCPVAFSFLLGTAFLICLPEGSLLPGRKKAAGFLMMVAVLFLVLLPLILPPSEVGGDGGKQWGPRFTFIIIPLALLLGGFVFEILPKLKKSPIKILFLTLLFLSICRAGFINSYQGYHLLQLDYSQRVLPVLRFLRDNENDIVVSNSQFVHQELESLFGIKKLFFVENLHAFDELSCSLVGKGKEKFLYVSDLSGPHLFAVDQQPGFIFRPLVHSAIYRVTEISIQNKKCEESNG